MQRSSIFSKILGETKFQPREFPRSGSTPKDVERKKKREKRKSQWLQWSLPVAWTNNLPLTVFLFFLLWCWSERHLVASEDSLITERFICAILACMFYENINEMPRCCCFAWHNLYWSTINCKFSNVSYIHHLINGFMWLWKYVGLYLRHI